MALDLGELRVRIGADLSEFSKGMASAQQTIATAGAKFEKAGAGLNTAMSGFSKTASGLLVPTSALGKNLDDVGKSVDQAGKHIHGAMKPAQGFTGALTDMHNQMSLLFGGGVLTAAFTAPFIGLTKAAFGAAISFESSFAGVRKTVSATEQEFAELEARFRSMAQEIPVSANELARIGELAGQLGVRGVGNISKFTEVIAKLGVTTNLSTEEAATSLARFANIMQMPISEAEKLGSTIVDLGNNLATTEQEITTFALRIAGAGKQIGLSEAEVVGFGGALSAVGINAEAGGTAISRVFVKLANAVANGGEDLEEFAKVAGMTGQQFAREFRDNAAQAVITFIEGLKGVSDSGANVFGVLEKLELQDIRVRDALLRTAGAGDLLRRSIDLASGAWEENTALNIEAAKRFETTESKLKVMKQRFEELLRTLAERAIPALTTLIDKANGAVKAFNDMSPASQNFIVGVLGFAAAIGPVLIGLALLGSAISGITALMTVMSAVAIPALAGAMTFLVANPIGMLIMAIGTTLVAAGILLIQNFDEIKRNSLNAWGKIKAFITDAAATIMEAMARLNFANPLNKGFGNKALLQQYLDQAAALRKLADAERTVIDVRNLAAKGLTIADDVDRLTDAYQRNLKVQQELGQLQSQYLEGDRALRQGYIDTVKATGAAWTEAHKDTEGATIAMATASEILESRVARVSGQFAIYQAQVDDSVPAQDRLSAAIVFLSAKLALQQQVVSALQDEYEASVTTTGAVSKASVDLASKLDSARQAEAETAKAVRDVNAEMTRLQFPLSDANTKLAVLGSQLKRVDAEMAMYKSSAGDAATSTSYLTKQQDFLTQKIALNNDKMGILQGMLDESTRKTGEYSPATLALAEALDSARVEGSGLAASLRDVEKALSPLGKMTQQTTQVVGRLDAQIGIVNAQLDIHKAQLGSTAATDAELSMQKDLLADKLGLVNLKIAQLSAQYATTRSQTGEFSAETQDARGKLDAAQRSAAGLEAEIRGINLAMTEFSPEVVAAKNNLKAATAAVEDMAGKVAEAESKVNLFRKQLDSVNQEIAELKTSSNDAQRGVETAFGAMEREASDLERQIRDTESALRGMGNIRLAGQGELEQQLFDLSMQEAQIRLQMNRLRQSGADRDNADLQALESQLSAIGLQREELQLKRDIDVAPLQRELKRLTEDTKEFTFDQAKQQIDEYQTKIVDLTTKHTDLTSRMAALREQVGVLVPSVSNAKVTFDEAEAAVETHRQKLLENAEKMGELTTKQEEARASFDLWTGRLEEHRASLAELRVEEVNAKTALEELREAAVAAAEALNRSAALGQPTTGRTPAQAVANTAAEQAKRAVQQGDLDLAAGIYSNLFNVPLDEARKFAEDLAKNLPGLAKGGSARRGGLAMVGERGPEIVNLPTGASVNPLPNLTAMLAGVGAFIMERIGGMMGGGGMPDFDPGAGVGGKGTVFLQVSGNTILGDDQKAARELARILEPYLLRRRVQLVVE